MALMRARHEVFGVNDVPDNDFYRENGWTEVDPTTPTAEQDKIRAINDARSGALIERPAAEVAAAVESLSDEDKATVVAAEKAGKGRRSVLDAAAE